MFVASICSVTEAFPQVNMLKHEETYDQSLECFKLEKCVRDAIIKSSWYEQVSDDDDKAPTN